VILPSYFHVVFSYEVFSHIARPTCCLLLPAGLLVGLTAGGSLYVLAAACCYAAGCMNCNLWLELYSIMHV
jgi:hypothetical protein